MDRLYEADCLWEEYMASSAVAYAKQADAASGSSTMVVFAGTSHLDRRALPLKIHKRQREGTQQPYTVLPVDVDWPETAY